MKARARQLSTTLHRQRMDRSVARRKLENTVTVRELRESGLKLPLWHPGTTAIPYDVEVWEDLLWYAWNPSLGMHAAEWTRGGALAQVMRQIGDCLGYEPYEIRLRVTHLL
jgi:hypothetical protein